MMLTFCGTCQTLSFAPIASDGAPAMLADLMHIGGCHLQDEQFPGIGEAIERLLRNAPEHWTRLDLDSFSAVEQRAVFLLEAAGLIEQRRRVTITIPGRVEGLEVFFESTGESGAGVALEAVVSELLDQSDSSTSGASAARSNGRPQFLVLPNGEPMWRLTAFGVMARGDLDIEARNEFEATILGTRQRAISFVLRSGLLSYRPAVGGTGRVIELKPVPTPARDLASSAVASSMAVHVVNSQEIATAVASAFATKLDRASDGTQFSAPVAQSADADELPPSLSGHDALIMRVLSKEDPHLLLSIEDLGEKVAEWDGRTSTKTIADRVAYLVQCGFAERPQGPRMGVRLTTRGRRVAAKIAG